jgi:NADH dehydrogenase FAD-containing subunit
LKERALMAGEHARRRRVLIVGGGFAGFHAARALSRPTMGLDVEVVLVARLTGRPPRTFAELAHDLVAAA